MNFEIVKHLKINWLKNKKNKDGKYEGAQDMVINSKGDSEICFLSYRKGEARMWTSGTPKQLLSVLDSNNGIYEIFSQYPYKVFFDIDKKEKTSNDYYNKVIDKITELFPNPDYATSGSITDTKTSYHITLNNYMINNIEDRNKIQKLVKYLKDNFDSAFDCSIYKTNSNMKCVNQSKPDGRVQAIIYNNNIKKHVITAFFNENSSSVHELRFPSDIEKEIIITEQIEKSKQKFDLSVLPVLKLELDENFILEDASPAQLVALLPLNNNKDDKGKKLYNHSYTHLIARYLYYNDCSFETFLSWYRQKSEDEIEINRWKYNWSIISRFPPVEHLKIVCILSKFYPNIVKNSDLLNFKKLFNIQTKKIDKLENDTLSRVSGKFVILNTGMGSGKTYQTIKYLKESSKYDDSDFIWMTPIIALAQNTKFRLEEDGVDCHYYQDTKKGDLAKHKNLIVCINSLYKISDRKYNIVVIDEIETLLNKWFNNDTFDKLNNKAECWERFTQIIKQADKVILLDAFTSKITVEFIQSFNPYTNNDLPTIISLNNEKSNREVNILYNKVEWMNNIINDLNDGKKLFIFYPYKDGNSSNISMKTLKNILQQITKKKGQMYNAQVDDNNLKELKDVNKNWTNYDFVLTNSKITVGINYELKDFDTVYISLASYTSTRDAVQVSYRCRHINTNIINVCFLEKEKTLSKIEKQSITKDDKLVDNCQIYKSLVSNLLTEKFAPLISSFLYFCELAHYKVNIKEKDMTVIYNYFNTELENKELEFSYENIKDINNDELEIINKKIYLSDATMDEKITADKHYFKLKFNSNTDPETLKTIWNKKYIRFMYQVEKIRDNKNNVFEKIANLNNWSSIFEGDLNGKIKLNDDILTQIFDEYHFKNLNKKSSSIAIVKEIYNTYFKYYVIKTDIKAKGYNMYMFNEQINDMYKFGLENLKTKEKTDIFMDDEPIDIFSKDSLLDKGIYEDDVDEFIKVITPPKINQPKINFTLNFCDE